MFCCEGTVNNEPPGGCVSAFSEGPFDWMSQA